MCKIFNGVKQGSVISPLLFTLYMDSLVLVLKQLGLGCQSKWQPECIDIYTQSFDVNEIATINDEIKLFVEHGSASQHESDQFHKSGKIAGVCKKVLFRKR